jgi:transcriptional regulator with XRE-family HTH domain
MESLSAGNLLREARLRHGLSQEDLAIRAGAASLVVSDIETDRVSPTVEMLDELLELLGEDLDLGAGERETGIDLTLNLGNLELRPGDRVQRGLAFADVVRENRSDGVEDLGRSLRLGPLLGALDRHEVDFVAIGSIAGLAYDSAYPTYDLDLAYAGRLENFNRMTAALGDVGVQMDGHLLGEHNAFSFDTEYGTFDILREIPGVETYQQLRRDSTSGVLAGVTVRLASLNHLIAMKRAANRVKDRLMVLEYVELADLRRRKEDANAS